MNSLITTRRHVVAAGVLAAALIAGRPAIVLGDACCLPSGTCQNLSQANCATAGGCWQGAGTTCATWFCEPRDTVNVGACILPNGTCIAATEADCLCLNGASLDHANLSFWAGAGTDCSTLPKVNYEKSKTPGGVDGGQINISGATLFVPFFQSPASYNDWNNADGDRIPCSGDTWNRFKDTNCSGGVDFIDGDRVDILGRPYVCGPQSIWTYWLFTYRSVGSVNGYNEFITWQLTGAQPTTIPTEEGLTNGCRWALGGAKTGPCSGCDAYCLAAPGSGDMDCDGDLDGLDIRGFIARIFGTPPCAPGENGDFNGDGLVDDGDIEGFVDCMIAKGGGCYQGNNPGGLIGQTGSPICPESIDGAFLDVPGKWGTRGPAGASTFRKTPNQPGYGRNPVPSFSGFISNLAALERELYPGGPVVSLNFNQDNPDGNTLYDVPVAFVPVVPISSQGTGVVNIKYTELQHLLVTGRMPNGENLVGTTRDVGSGTRNAYNNALGVDPSWGMGDNEGAEIFNENPDIRGPGVHLGYVLNGTLNQLHYSNNCGGSGISERATQNRRLAIGYTGLFGNGRAISDAIAGNYEILNVCKDIDGDGDGNIDSDCGPSSCDNAVGGPGCPTPVANWTPANAGYVRPTVDTVLDNTDPHCSYTVGASGSFVFRGDPESGRPGHIGNPEMSNKRARDYILNIIDSIAAFVNVPGLLEAQQSPAQFLATRFTLLPGLDASQDQNIPTKFDPAFPENQSLQDIIRCTTTQITPPYGHNGNPALFNKIPQRVNQTSAFITLPEPYSDGSTTGSYRNNAGAFTIAGGGNLSFSRCKLMGDFNADGSRDWLDIDKLMVAVKNPAAFQADDVAGGVGGLAPAGGLATDYIIPELIGDFDGDGNFGDRVAASYIEIPGPGGTSTVGTIEPGVEMSDVRYFADGLALDPGTRALDRKEGFTRVDNAWLAVTPGDNNFFNTTLKTRKVYAPGDSRGDVAGNVPHPGSNAVGADGCIDAEDIDYVFVNFIANWANTDDAIDFARNARKDLSCDIDGDLDVDAADVTELVEVILCSRAGDADLDGDVDAADLAIVNGNLGMAGGWAIGDFTGDGAVDAADQAICTANQGFVSPCAPLSGPACP